MDNDRFLTLYLRLRDRFGEHGLVGHPNSRARRRCIAIDTWLMSCRVIGRTVENTMFYELCQPCRATRWPTDTRDVCADEKNGLVRDLFPRLGFELDADLAGSVKWVYDVAGNEAPANEYIETSGDARRVAA